MAPPIRLGVKAVILQDEHLVLIEYTDEKGVHYNLPGGGIKRGESVRKALRREVLEETTCEVKVGRLLLVSEYDPRKQGLVFGRTPKLTLIFQCHLKDGSIPQMPPSPDANQTAVRLFPLDSLPESLYPQHHDLLQEAIRTEDLRQLFTTGK